MKPFLFFLGIWSILATPVMCMDLKQSAEDKIQAAQDDDSAQNGDAVSVQTGNMPEFAQYSGTIQPLPLKREKAEKAEKAATLMGQVEMPVEVIAPSSEPAPAADQKIHAAVVHQSMPAQYSGTIQQPPSKRVKAEKAQKAEIPMAVAEQAIEVPAPPAETLPPPAETLPPPAETPPPSGVKGLKDLWEKRALASKK